LLTHTVKTSEGRNIDFGNPVIGSKLVAAKSDEEVFIKKPQNANLGGGKRGPLVFQRGKALFLHERGKRPKT